MNFKALFDFLNDLSSNNNKIWFDENRSKYEILKVEFQSIVGKLISSIGEFDSEIRTLEVKNCVFRINKDVRFSKDKAPYKTNFGTYFAKGGKKSIYGGYYLHLEPNKSFLATGVWMPLPENLKSIRQEIDYNFDNFQEIMAKPNFLKYFNNLPLQKTKNVPKGYENSNPAAEYLKNKSFILSINLEDSVFDENFIKNITKKCLEFKPFLDFINHAIENEK